MELGGQKLTVFQSNSEDPYITVPDEIDESDDEDEMILETDSVICTGVTSEEHSVMQMHIFEESGENLYVHHDFPIPSFPVRKTNFCCNTNLEFRHRSPCLLPVVYDVD